MRSIGVVLLALLPSLPWSRATMDLSRLVPMMPPSLLPGPGNVKLRYVLLGVGTQNYTCSTGNATAEPASAGALARLYDIGTALNVDVNARELISSVSCMTFNLQQLYGQKKVEKFLEASGYPLKGHHWFTGPVPTFSLEEKDPMSAQVIYVTKVGDVDPPETSCSRNKEQGAIKWLFLNGSSTKPGSIHTVYRLETAGGNKPRRCGHLEEHVQVEYVAQYWLYGND